MAVLASGDRLSRSASWAIAGSQDSSAPVRQTGAGAARRLALARRNGAAARYEGARALDGAEFVMRAAGQRVRAAEHRAQAAQRRRLAPEDRATAVADRARATDECRRAIDDLDMLARSIAGTEMDSLLRAHTPAAGVPQLDQQLARCRRTAAQLVVIRVAVAEAPAPAGVGNRALRDGLRGSVAGATDDRLRVHDLVVRDTGVELVCAIANTTLRDARSRLRAVADAVADVPGAATITAGFAELTADETAARLIARAGRELTSRRRAATSADDKGG